MSIQEVKINVDITGTDKFRAMAALTAQAILTHPNRNELERAFYEIIGEKPEVCATGGKMSRGGLAIVGERGPELLHMPSGSSVKPVS